jgi:cytochrome c oxidase subunit I+III
MDTLGADIDKRTLQEHERLELRRAWKPLGGIIGALCDNNHTVIGKRIIVTAFCFFAFGGVLAALMRIQLMFPEHRFLNPDLYNQIFTTHGSTMMFLFAVPVMEGMGIYLVPTMVGTRNVAFPRLNVFGYYCYLIGGLLLFTGFILNIGPDAGWFAYTPLSGPEFSAGKRVDFWAQMITFTEIAALVGAVELIVTILKQRAPGMTLNRIPLFVWSILVMSFMVVFAMPAIVLASSYLAMDRLVGTHFFNQAEGGDHLMWQHLFWFFGHPEVYIIFVPALGFVSEIITTFTRRPVFGYTAMVLSLVSTGFIGFGLWVHHMFTTGLPQLGRSFFTAASVMIAVPSGIQIFCWIATIWLGKARFKVPMLYVIAFFALFIFGGLTGVLQASVPIDTQVHDSFFVVGHFHYTLIGGAVFPLFGALYYWFPKITGRMLDEKIGRIGFWTLFLGFNLTFFPMHALGLMGMPRRVYTYLADTGWGPLNLLATIGAAIVAIAVVIFVVNVIRSLLVGEIAGEDPWGGATLEWSTASPPEHYIFEHLPTVTSRTPMWAAEPAPVIVGMRTDCRETLVTTGIDAHPDHRHDSANPSIWPFLTAVATGMTFVGVIFTSWAIPVGLVLMTVTLVGWFWMKNEPEHNVVGKASS